MSGSTLIPDGRKFTSPQGTRAVKGGQKPNAGSGVPDVGRKPPWLRVKLPGGARYEAVADIVRTHQLNTVCAESKCPNIAECWGRGTATLMLMGSVCTRACRFCSVSTGNPQGWLDPLEPAKVADAVALMGLQYVVLTSVDRDDLADGGAAHYAACVRAIHRRSATTPRWPPCWMRAWPPMRRTWRRCTGSPTRCAIRVRATGRPWTCWPSPSVTPPEHSPRPA